MKRSIVNSLATMVIASCVIVFAGCGARTESTETTPESATTDESESTEMEATHVCPMHADITGHEGDKCSKCGMTLEAMADAEDSIHHHGDH